MSKKWEGAPRFEEFEAVAREIFERFGVAEPGEALVVSLAGYLESYLAVAKNQMTAS